MAVEPVWVPIDVVIRANEREVARSNPPEPHQILDLGKLEGAVERPRTAWGYGVQDMAELAVSLFEGIAHAHAFSPHKTGTARADGTSDHLDASNDDLRLWPPNLEIRL